ncbi:AAA family ATPase [Geminicoccus sp.]|uniref:AAA family ATPase n=1 Tax=Geminicoccus sp. TaxID=2024832 RepID=UPI002E2EAD44|nr:AAA family ATPase [Geminicoccus sp.]
MCGFASPEAMRFCGQCGQPLAPDLRTVPSERRNVTVVFIDMVGSTALSAKLDPEDLHGLMSAYWALCTDMVLRFGGEVGEYLGDGVVAYFGYPRVREDAVECALLASLAVVQRVPSLGRDRFPTLQARVGIATGVAVVDEFFQGARLARKPRITGETPNVAARLQALALPGGIVIGNTTREIAGALFDYEDLGPQHVRGLDKPVHAWRVVRESGIESRLEARLRFRLTPVVGRQEEMAALEAQWTEAISGQGRIAVLIGEPGIGKSRLARNFMEAVANPRCRILRFYSSAAYAATSLYPLVRTLERASDMGVGQTSGERLAKLEDYLEEATGAPTRERLALFAHLLDITDPSLPALDLTPQRRRQRTIEELYAFLGELSANGPLVILWEDIHWADASSLEFLAGLPDRIAALPVLVILTSRPEGPLAALPIGSAHIVLDRLDQRQSELMLDRLSEDKPLPPSVRSMIVDRADGVPLFLEELARTVRESGGLIDRGDSWELTRPIEELRIPVTLMDSLTARIERLGSAKEMAQLASAIGRRFSIDMLEAMNESNPETVAPALRRLAEAGLVDVWDEHSRDYVFRHALIQDAAYRGMLRSRRKRLHGRIADTLVQRFPQRCEAEPEGLAQHLGLAGRPLESGWAWQRAGARAASRAAFAEAVVHFEAGLREAKAAAPSRERDLLEAELSGNLGATLMQSRGFAAAEVEAAYQTAYAACTRVGDDAPQMMPVLWGRAVHRIMVGDVRSASEVVERMQRIANLAENEDLLLLAHGIAGGNSFYAGRFGELIGHVAGVRSIYDLERHRPLAFAFGMDLLLQATLFEAHARWMQGEAELSRRIVEESDIHFDALAVPIMAPYLLVWGGAVLLYRGDVEPALARIERGVEVADRQGFAFWSVCGRVWQAVAMLDAGRIAEGAEALAQWLGVYTQIGTGIGVPYFKSRLADALARQDRREEALRLVQEGLDQIARMGEGCWHPEVLRLHGEILATGPASNLPAAASAWRESLAIAKRQGALSWQLRTALSLARRAPTASEGTAALREILPRLPAGNLSPEQAEGHRCLAVRCC